MSDQRAGEAGHRALPHTADVIVEAWAPSRAGCLEELVRGFVETFADVRGVPGSRTVPVDVAATDGVDAVIGLLDDACYLLDTEGLVVVDVTIGAADADRLAGSFLVAPLAAVAQVGAPPKGISRSELEFGHTGTRWHARVLVDV